MGSRGSVQTFDESMKLLRGTRGEGEEKAENEVVRSVSYYRNVRSRNE